jgi:hypothetical protein
LLKEALTSEDTVLTRPDFTKPFILQTDASGYRLSAVLSQKGEDGRERVVSYASRTLLKPEQKWHLHEHKLMVAIWGCEHFRPYLIGLKFVLQTDNSAVKWLLKQTKPAGRLQRWILRLQEFDFNVEHRPGTSNANADGPSRNPVYYNLEDEEKLERLALGLPDEPMALLVKVLAESRDAKTARRPFSENERAFGQALVQRDDILAKFPKWDWAALQSQIAAHIHRVECAQWRSTLPATMANVAKESYILESDLFRKVFADAQNKDPFCSTSTSDQPPRFILRLPTSTKTTNNPPTASSSTEINHLVAGPRESTIVNDSFALSAAAFVAAVPSSASPPPLPCSYDDAISPDRPDSHLWIAAIKSEIDPLVRRKVFSEPGFRVRVKG